jgi:chromosomal replication initiation ATPase DnaA
MVWRITMQQLELQMDRASFYTWMRDMKLVDRQGSRFTVAVRNQYAQAQLQGRLYRTVWRVLSDVACCGPIPDLSRHEVEICFDLMDDWWQPDPAAAAAPMSALEAG